MAEIALQDSRGFFVLPQKPEQGGLGYYTYGTPLHGAGQYVHPKLLSLICMIEHRWQGTDDRKIGIGNISLAGGLPYKGHDSHQSGCDMDIRLFRKDGKEDAVNRLDEQYDRDATARLIGMFFESAIIKVIFFNDALIPRVRPLSRHDDHFHITIQA